MEFLNVPSEFRSGVFFLNLVFNDFDDILHIYIWLWSVVIVRIIHILTANICEMVTDMANITIAIKYEITIKLTLAHFTGQLGHWNGVWPNILALFLIVHSILRRCCVFTYRERFLKLQHEVKILKMEKTSSEDEHVLRGLHEDSLARIHDLECQVR